MLEAAGSITAEALATLRTVEYECSSESVEHVCSVSALHTDSILLSVLKQKINNNSLG